MAKIEERVNHGGEEGSDKNSGQRNFIFRRFWLEEEKWKRGEKADYESDEERVKISSIEIQVGGWTEGRADNVYVRNDAGQDDRDSGGAGDAREGSALKRVRSQGVGEEIHGECLS